MSATQTAALRFQVSLNAQRQPVVTAVTPGGRRKNRPTEVKAGSVVVKVYGKKGPFTISWYETADGDRSRAMRSDRAKAISFAEAKATELYTAEKQLGVMTPADKVRTVEWNQRAAKLELTADQIFSRGEEVIIAERTRARIVSKKCPDVVTELIQVKTADGAGENWIKDLAIRLNRFATHFTGPLDSIRDEDITAWLAGLRDLTSLKKEARADAAQVAKCPLLSKRSRNNYRTAIQALAAYARGKYIPKDSELLSQVAIHEIEKGEEEVYTPKEMRSLLFTAEKHYPKHLPVLASMAFSGCRHCEFCDEDNPEAHVLEWRHFHFDRKLIHVQEAVAKANTGRRYAPMPDNLVAWLQPYRSLSGPICSVTKLTGALHRIAQKAGIKWKRNALRNSYISYRVAITNDIPKVAREAGNSPTEIGDSYLKELTEQEAKEYFGIMPTTADILPLFAHAQVS